MVSTRTVLLEEKLDRAVKAYKTAPEYSSYRKTATAFGIRCFSTLQKRAAGHTRAKSTVAEKRQLLSCK